MITNALLALAMGGLAAVFSRLERSAAGPATAFAAVWAALAATHALAPGLFLPIGDATRLVVLLGALAFAAGAFVAGTAGSTLPAPRPVPLPSALLTGFLVVLVAGLPLYAQEILRIAGGGDLLTLLYRVRARQVSGDPSASFGPVGNLVQLALIVPVLLYALPRETRWARWRAVLAVVVALLYQVGTGGRSGVLALFASLGGLAVLVRGREGLRALAGFGATGIGLFLALAIALQKGTARPDASLADNARAAIENLLLYFAGSLVALDAIVQDPLLVPSTGGAWRTVAEAARKLGADIEIPSLHAQFVTVGDAVEMNTFTTYFAYLPDAGLAGTLLLVAGAGAACGLAFAHARRGSLAARVLYAMLFAAILQSVFNEAFYTNVNLLGKASLLMVALVALSRWRAADPATAAMPASSGPGR